MKGMTLEAVAKACDGIYHGSDGDKIKEVSAITTDSRALLYHNRNQYKHARHFLHP